MLFVRINVEMQYCGTSLLDSIEENLARLGNIYSSTLVTNHFLPLT